MLMSNAIALIELSSIALGYAVEDAMLDAANIKILLARTICSGKYLVVVGGTVADVNSALEAGINAAPGAVIDHIVIPNIHESVFSALSSSAQLEAGDIGALGVVETFSAVTAIEAGDAAAKAANIILFRIHVAMAIGGKGFIMVTGDVAAVQAAVEAAAQLATDHGLLVAKCVIPRPNRELFHEYI